MTLLSFFAPQGASLADVFTPCCIENEVSNMQKCYKGSSAKRKVIIKNYIKITLKVILAQLMHLKSCLKKPAHQLFYKHSSLRSFSGLFEDAYSAVTY